MLGREQDGNVNGVGVGYRSKFHDVFFSSERPDISWIEVVTENFLPRRGEITRSIQKLRELRKNYPVALHGVSLSLGSTEPVSRDYLERLRWLEQDIDPWMVSDHLCWTGAAGENLHDLLPLPLTGESLDLVAGKIHLVQDFLRRTIAVENISYYLNPVQSEMSEAEFLNQLHRRTGCRFVLDLNNIYVNAYNLGLEPRAFLSRLNLAQVAQIHLAGHVIDSNGVMVDNHGAPVHEDVWALYEWVQEKIGRVPTMIERDENIPEWEVLNLELERLRQLQKKEGRRETLRMANAVLGSH
jgi:uncharacterized protein (UPF0276 family)